MEKLLIEEVKKRNFLYDTKSPYYRDLNRRTNAWKEIGGILQVKPDVAKYTWEKLRRCFSNALQRRKNRKFAVERRERQPWKFETNMSFLVEIADSNGPADGAEMKELRFPDNFEQNEYLGQSVHDPRNKRTRNISVSQQMENSTNYDISHVNTNGMSSINRPRLDSENFHAVMIENIKQEVEDKYNSRRLEMKLQNIEDNFDSPEQIKIATCTHYLLDETDMFFLSLSKTTKTLSPTKQAKVKLLVSQAVLQNQLAEEEDRSKQYHGT